MIIINEKTKYPPYDCPRFNICSSPKCPLDPDMDKRIKYKNEDKCKAWKKTRMEIAKKYPNLLPHKGLTKREYVGYKMRGRYNDYEQVLSNHS